MSVLDEKFDVSVNYNEMYGSATATWIESMIEFHKGQEAQYLMDIRPMTVNRKESAFDILSQSADIPIEMAIARWVHNRFGEYIHGCSVMPVTEVVENPYEDRYIVVLGNDQPVEYYRLSNILVTLNKYKYDK